MRQKISVFNGKFVFQTGNYCDSTKVYDLLLSIRKIHLTIVLQLVCCFAIISNDSWSKSHRVSQK